jgi:hypothetical protein
VSTATVQRLPHLAPVSLEELVEEAGLLARVDRKYVVPVAQAWQLLGAVPEEARVLEIDGRREFGYSSTYFDTPDRASFLTSGRGHRGRWKTRTRSYLDTGGSWLEVKTHGARGQTIKQRIEHEDSRCLTPGGIAFVLEVIGERAAALLEPVLVTEYRRTTLLLPSSTARVTIDTDLVWRSLTGGGGVSRPETAIVETKTGAIPSDVDRLLWSRGHRPVQISKYGVGMAALEPVLPRLKWHRAMERHLDIQPVSRPGRPSR